MTESKGLGWAAEAVPVLRIAAVGFVGHLNGEFFYSFLFIGGETNG